MNKFLKTYWAYRNKISNKLWGTARMPARGKKKGVVLLSYFTEPFTRTPWEPFSNFHTMYWECFEIARLFSERGYAVDIINAKEKKFIPKKPYVVCIDTEDNFERFIPYLPKNCKKVFHILISWWKAYNEAEQKRLDGVEKRRGVRLSLQRRVPPSRNAELSDYLEGFGNKTIFSTFAQFQKPIHFIPISTVLTFDFPETKNFDNAKKHFLWFGGGGAVLKGLDLALEAFSKTPELHLHICGPVYAEKDFVHVYKKELEETPNIHVYGRLNIESETFKKIIDNCASVIYPSGGEGSSGAIVQVMHAGLIPIITHETGIQEDSEYLPLENPTPDSIIREIRIFSTTPTADIKIKAKKIWEYTRKRYTRSEFSRVYAEFIDTTLKI